MILIQKTEGRLFNFSTDHVISKSVLWALKTVTQESSKWLPKSDGGRVIVSTWLLASLVFLSSYSGILTAMLTIPKVTIPIDSLEDLVLQSNLPWKLLTGSFLSDYFKESKDPVRQKAYKGAIGTVPDCWYARQEIMDGKFAGICVETTAYKVYSWDFSTTGSCHVYIAREKVYTNSLFSLIFKKGSPYLEKTNNVLHSLKESGIMSKWLNQHLINGTQCKRPPSRDLSGRGIRALNIEALVGPFILLVSGFILAFLAFLGEIKVSSKEE
ncbi:glutamate receptor 1-like [Palaemon carinicauda]|uniref:glutamate receptor 1-like n=1 Tax=Palaemon carinicauda TaxID=392227 RepID=UPI0035B574F2